MNATHDPDCIFCQIAAKQIPSELVYEDEHVLGFKDIKPEAPVHVLVIPKRHIATIGDIHPGHLDVLPHLYAAAIHIAKEQGIFEEGYRLVMNSGDNGGQTVYHIHMHVLGGRVMRWPPG